MKSHHVLINYVHAINNNSTHFVPSTTTKSLHYKCNIGTKRRSFCGFFTTRFRLTLQLRYFQLRRLLSRLRQSLLIATTRRLPLAIKCLFSHRQVNQAKSTIALKLSVSVTTCPLLKFVLRKPAHIPNVTLTISAGARKGLGNTPLLTNHAFIR